MKVAFLGDPARIQRVFASGRREAVEALGEVLPGVVESHELDSRLAELEDVEALFSTWGMPALTPAQLDRMPKLRAVFYAAGAVNHFARPLLERGIMVSSAWQANGVPVAEFVLAQILLSCKGYFRNTREFAANPVDGKACHVGPGAFGETVAILGAGAIGTKLIELLRTFRLEVIVYDPLLKPERTQTLGVRQASLEAAFREGFVVSNHLVDNSATVGLIDGNLLATMRPNATFINTGRGRTVRSDDLQTTLADRPDLTALLDVTDPEPLPPTSPLRQLPNIQISTHIAGSVGDEVLRLADYTIEDFTNFRDGRPFRYAVYESDLPV